MLSSHLLITWGFLVGFAARFGADKLRFIAPGNSGPLIVASFLRISAIDFGDSDFAALPLAGCSCRISHQSRFEIQSAIYQPVPAPDVSHFQIGEATAAAAP